MKKNLLYMLSFCLSANFLSAQNYGGGGMGFSLAICSDSSLQMWGNNQNFTFGNGANSNSNIPISGNPLTGIKSIVGGMNHAAALKDDGTVWTWGLNGNGQLGNGTFTSSSTPV